MTRKVWEKFGYDLPAELFSVSGCLLGLGMTGKHQPRKRRPIRGFQSLVGEVHEMVGNLADNYSQTKYVRMVGWSSK